MGIVMFLSQNIFAQKETENLWKSGRPDGHAPISVMGDHYHKKGGLMFSYRFMNMNMEGLLNGTKTISNNEAHNAGYMVTPLKMPMKMHMLGAMYAVSNNITLVAMAMYTQNDMDLQMRMPTGMTREFSTSSSGFGDLKIGAIYKILNKNRQSLHGQLNVSIPTGKIDAEDSTPMSAPNKIQLPYPMQIGSGTFDTDLAITYLGQNGIVSWGSQLKITIRFGENDDDYSLGNRYGLNSWFAIKTTNWLSFSGRIEGLIVDNINGENLKLNPMMVTTADTQNFGGNYVNSAVGFNMYIPKGSFKNIRLGFEYAYPIFQDLNGIQLKQEETITIGLQYSL